MSLLPVVLSHLSLTLIAVALSGGAIHFYNGRQLVEKIVAADTIAGMIFGQFGQEDHCLIMVTISKFLPWVKPKIRNAHSKLKKRERTESDLTTNNLKSTQYLNKNGRRYEVLFQ